jgi:acyl-CoA synthetase (AMP-forming)/AMP-acid ligase II
VDTKDRTKELAAGELGEIVFRGPTLFVGYHKQPELTAQTRDDEGWFYTSDLGSVDDEGYLTYAGRAKEVINRGGTKIYPKEIEDLLNAHPRVVDAAVVGWPDERMGERVCAYVIPADGKDLSVEEVSDYFTAEKVTRYMIPEFVINLSEFPMTPTGKVRKAALQEDAAERARNVG